MINLTYLRIRLETEAANLILSKVKSGQYELVFSPIHLKEIDAILDSYERIELRERLKILGKIVKIQKAAAKKRAEEFYKLKFGIADAAHVAFAEHCGAEFISCDDSLLKKCYKHKVKVWCGNPVTFCEKEEIK